MSDTIKSGIDTAVDDILAKFGPQDLKIPPEKQYDQKDPRNITDPMRIYACWFTWHHMYFQKTEGLALSWQEYRTECIASGGMTESFKILDETDKVSKMAAAAGVKAIRRDTTSNMAFKISELLNHMIPPGISLNGEHYMPVTGRQAGGLVFTTEDPGYQNDTCLDAKTLEVFHIDDHGNRIYSKSHNGGHRRCTRVFWFERTT